MSSAELSADTVLASSFRSVPDMWHHRVESTPDMVGMYRRQAGSWAPITWQQAAARVRAVANALLAMEIEPEQRCAILSESCVEWIYADLGILCAGAATTPIYPTTTDADIVYILNDCQAQMVFCDSALQANRLKTLREQIPTVRRLVVFNGSPEESWQIGLDDFEELGRGWGLEHPDAYEAASRSIGPDQLATLMYTSGTTGTPKGVMLSHDAWVYEAEAIDALALMSPADKQYLFLPLSHVFAKVMQVIFIRLGIPTAVHGDTEDLLRYLQEVQPTFLAAVPRVFEKLWMRIVAESEQSGAFKRSVFEWAVRVGEDVSRLRQQGRQPSGILRLRYSLANRLVFSKVKALFGGRVRFLISGGAPLSTEIAAFFHACDVLVLEGYGLTESAAASCVNIPSSFSFGTVGLPVPGCQVRIAEDGEILLKSRGVMRGYYNLPEQTREALTKDGWLKTGDIGTILPSGHVQITDRKKDIIVTAGGKNIAPAAFEHRLKTRSPYISEVMMHGDRRPFCSALITLDVPELERWAREQELSWTDQEDLFRKPEVRRLIQGDIDRVNSELASFENVKAFALLPEDFTVENGLLTPTLKVRRRAVETRYADALDAFYEES